MSRASACQKRKSLCVHPCASWICECELAGESFACWKCGRLFHTPLKLEPQSLSLLETALLREQHGWQQNVHQVGSKIRRFNLPSRSPLPSNVFSQSTVWRNDIRHIPGKGGQAWRGSHRPRGGSFLRRCEKWSDFMGHLVGQVRPGLVCTLLGVQACQQNM